MYFFCKVHTLKSHCSDNSLLDDEQTLAAMRSHPERILLKIGNREVIMKFTVNKKLTQSSICNTVWVLWQLFQGQVQHVYLNLPYDTSYLHLYCMVGSLGLCTDLFPLVAQHVRQLLLCLCIHRFDIRTPPDQNCSFCKTSTSLPRFLHGTSMYQPGSLLLRLLAS